MSQETEARYRPAERVTDEELVEIRIRPDGKILFHGTSEEFLEIAAEVCPNDPWLQERMRVMEIARRKTESADNHVMTKTEEEKAT